MASILFIATINWFIPMVLASIACSRVWPSALIPASNSPFLALTTRIAASAWLAPVIMFLTKSLWPGASMMVKKYFFVSNFMYDSDIVTPRSRSSFILSSSHANLKLSLPIFLDSSSIIFTVFSSKYPRRYSMCPVIVLLPWSTCPIITIFKCGFCGALTSTTFQPHQHVISSLISLGYL
uniref:ORFC 179 n=1 Tax=Desulfurococcus mucosus TaxID=2275 RepID=Q46516_DESMO|nr:unnamed protein product [Desulfurococcus mucosus DSM 2161]